MTPAHTATATAVKTSLDVEAVSRQLSCSRSSIDTYSRARNKVLPYVEQSEWQDMAAVKLLLKIATKLRDLYTDRIRQDHDVIVEVEVLIARCQSTLTPAS